MQTETKCPLCNGNKHINKDGKLERCDCLIQETVKRKLQDAGVTVTYPKISYAYISKTYKNVNQDTLKMAEMCSNTLKKGKFPYSDYSLKNGYRPILCFHGSASGAKEVLVASILKDAVLGGFDVVSVSLEDLINRHFKEQTSLTEQYFRQQVMHVSFGNEAQFNLANNFLRDLFRLGMTSESFLFLSTFLKPTDITNPNQAKYESDIIELFKDKKIQSFFVE